MAGSTQEKMILMAQMASEGDTPGKLLFIQKYFPLAFFFLTASVISSPYTAIGGGGGKKPLF